MSKEAKEFFSTNTDSINKLGKYLSDYPLITDMVTKLVITFGMVLIVGGLYLMTAVVGTPTSATQSVVSYLDWVPGIPFYMGNLAHMSVSTVGIVSWLIGLDLLLVGLGLWVRHKLARFTAMMIFALAALFQFSQFMQFGILNAPTSLIGFVASAILVYFLLSKFDSPAGVKKQPIS